MSLRKTRVNGELSAEQYADAARKAAPTSGLFNNRSQTIEVANFFATMAVYERLSELTQLLDKS